MDRRRALMTGRKSRNILNCIRQYNAGDTGVTFGGWHAKDKTRIEDAFSTTNNYVPVYALYSDGGIDIITRYGNGSGVDLPIRTDGNDFCISYNTNVSEYSCRYAFFDSELNYIKFQDYRFAQNVIDGRYYNSAVINNQPEGTVYVVLHFAQSPNANFDYKNIMVNFGTTPLPYEPYGAKPLSDNLLDIYTLNPPNATIGQDGLLTITGNDGTAWNTKPYITLPAGDYTLSCDNYDVSIDARTPAGVSIKSARGWISFTLSAQTNVCVKFNLQDPSIPQSCYVQLEKGNCPTIYRPFVSTT